MDTHSWPEHSSTNSLVALGSKGKTDAEQAAFIRAAADHIAPLEWERLVWIGPDGEAFHLDGERDAVEVGGHEASFTDAWAIHNHPGGTSFSVCDYTEAVRLNTRRFEIVTKESRQVIARPSTGWPETLLGNLFRSAYQSLRANAQKGMNQEEATRAVQKVVAARMRSYIAAGVD